MPKPFLLLLLVCLAFSLFACSGKTEELPGINMPTEEMNHEIILIANPSGGEPVPKNNNSIYLQLKNLTDEVFAFPGDFNSNLFIKENGNWVEVKNLNHEPDIELLLPQNEVFPLGRIVSITPSIPVLEEPVLLRVVVIGNIQDKPHDKVGAYIDIMLEP